VKDENLGEKEEIEIKDIDKGIEEIEIKDIDKGIEKIALQVQQYVIQQRNEVCKELLIKIGMDKNLEGQEIVDYIEELQKKGYKCMNYTVDSSPNVCVLTISKDAVFIIGALTLFIVGMENNKIVVHFKSVNMDEKYFTISDKGEFSFVESEWEELFKLMNKEPEKDEK
jgi:hypothetical protein